MQWLYSFIYTKTEVEWYCGRLLDFCYLTKEHEEFSLLILTYQKHLLLAPGLHLPVISSLLTSLRVVLQGSALLAVITDATMSKLKHD